MTVHPLPLIVPFHADESPMSFLSRLAVRNGTRARMLCSDLEISFPAVVAGEPDALRHVAAIGRIDADHLIQNAIVKTDQHWICRGQILDRAILRRSRTAICPACALADIEAAPNLRPQAAVYGRWSWLMEPARTCPLHRIPLVVSEESTAERLHDFAYHAVAFLPRLVDLATAPQRDPGPFEAYVFGRFGGRAASPLLDRMPLAAAARLCETAGAVALSGPNVNLKNLTEDDRHAAGARGYEALAAGPDAVRTFLDGLIQALGTRKRIDGPRVALGRFYTLLEATQHDPAFDEIRDAVREHILGNFAFEDGQTVLGRPVEGRRFHTVHSLARETGTHPKTLRKHLAAALDEADAAKSDNNVRIDANQAAEIAASLAETLTLIEAMKRIGAPRAQIDVLIRAGIVTPATGAANQQTRKRYAIGDLDDLLARLIARPRQATRSDCTIPMAAKRACCSAADIVRLVLDGKLRTAKGRARGYMGVLVDVRAVLKAVRGPQPDGISRRKAAREIGTSDRVLEGLIAQGHIASFEGINPVNGCPQTLVPNEEIERFKLQYVSLWTLSKERGIYMGTLKGKLDRAGLKPALDRATVGARFYSRDLAENSSMLG